MRNKIYIILIAAAFLAIAVVFNTFPRSKYSVLEKRDLKTFPSFTKDKLANGSFTKEISEWFSDSEPYRDLLMSFSMSIKDYERMVLDDDNITFHAAEEPTPEELEAQRKAEEEARERTPNRTAKEYENKLTANENAKIAHAGIIVVGSGEKVRAMMAYGGEPGGGLQYAKIANLYKQTFPEVNVYCMVVPIAIDFYCPDKVKQRTKSQLPTINNIYANLDEDVKAIDVYTTLGEHASGASLCQDCQCAVQGAEQLRASCNPRFCWHHVRIFQGHSRKEGTRRLCILQAQGSKV